MITSQLQASDSTFGVGADVYLDGEKIREGRQFVADDLKQLNPENLV